MQRPYAPVRSCTGCRKKDRKSQLRRFTLVNDVVTLQNDVVQPGRGTYLCKACHEIYTTDEGKHRRMLSAKLSYALHKHRK